MNAFFLLRAYGRWPRWSPALLDIVYYRIAHHAGDQYWRATA